MRTDTNSVPDWVKEQIELARTLFCLGPEWSITATLADKPGGEDDYDGACKADAIYLNAKIELSRSLTNDDYGRRVVRHEMGHVALAQIDLVVRYILSNIYDESQREIFRQMYSDAQEQFLQRLTRGLEQGEVNAPGYLQSPHG